MKTGSYNDIKNFDNNNYDSGIDLSSSNAESLAVGIISTISAGSNFVYLIGWPNTVWSQQGYMALGAENQDVASKSTLILAGIATVIVGTICIGGFYTWNGIINSDGSGTYYALIPNNLISSILTSNELEDFAISRDVFGAIAINPVFNNISDIPLDSSSPSTLNFLQETTIDFIQRNQAAFDNLTSCLQNNMERSEECDYAAMYFYNDFKDRGTSGIISLFPASEDL